MAFDTSQLVSDISLRWIYDGGQYMPTDFLVYLLAVDEKGRTVWVDEQTGLQYSDLRTADAYILSGFHPTCLSNGPAQAIKTDYSALRERGERLNSIGQQNGDFHGVYLFLEGEFCFSFGKTEKLRRDKERERRVPLSTVESSERQGKKLKANNGAKGEGVREMNFCVLPVRLPWEGNLIIFSRHEPNPRHREKIRLVNFKIDPFCCSPSIRISLQYGKLSINNYVTDFDISPELFNLYPGETVKEREREKDVLKNRRKGGMKKQKKKNMILQRGGEFVWNVRQNGVARISSYERGGRGHNDWQVEENQTNYFEHAAFSKMGLRLFSRLVIITGTKPSFFSFFPGAVSNPRLVSSTRRKRIDRVSPTPVVNRIRATIIGHDLRTYFGRCELHSTKWDKSSPFVKAELNVGRWIRAIKLQWKLGYNPSKKGSVAREVETEYSCCFCIESNLCYIILRCYIYDRSRREHSEPGSGKLPPSPLIVRYSNNSNKYMAVHGRARWFYENMVDSGQYHTMETIIGLRTAAVSAVCIATTNFRWEAITVACGRRLLRAAVTSALNSSMHISIFHLLKIIHIGPKSLFFILHSTRFLGVATAAPPPPPDARKEIPSIPLQRTFSCELNDTYSATSATNREFIGLYLFFFYSQISES
ncbi:hypothetical protein ALC57_16733 [Trachymyrmex cornetzi]|uniref:Uncharacterized protein n=1 Tax=Trachymyrmex cornetzi TaxID=471704 RepID=A0A195DE67_9HYME|nr:hypothetical protein ALC57_16733 [Trachymyrmex cornetzi]